MSSLFQSYVDNILSKNPGTTYKRIEEETDEKYTFANVNSDKSSEYKDNSRIHFQDYLELIYVVGSTLNMYINGKIYEGKSGDMFIIFPGDLHKIEADSGNVRYISIGTDPDFVLSPFISSFAVQYVIPSELNMYPGSRHMGYEELDKTGMPHLIYEISREASDKGNFYQYAIKTYLSNIFLELLRNWEEKGITKKLNDSGKESQSLSRITIIVERVRTDFASNLSTSDMADTVGMSYSYFSRCFKDLTGENFTEYLTKTRINEAKYRLKNTNTPVSKIATEVGFSNPSYFIAMFRKYTGQTPKKFRDSK
ncbi:MAG: helix-turn-helix transcriptional regulator [Clostridiales bacterium]|nr:helix-turn-helix transcriptional regulator [Clostridiales bacterium]